MKITSQKIVFEKLKFLAKAQEDGSHGDIPIGPILSSTDEKFWRDFFIRRLAQIFPNQAITELDAEAVLHILLLLILQFV